MINPTRNFFRLLIFAVLLPCSASSWAASTSDTPNNPSIDDIIKALTPNAAAPVATQPAAKGCSYLNGSRRILQVNGKPECIAYLQCSGNQNGSTLCSPDPKTHLCPTDANVCANDGTIEEGANTLTDAQVMVALCLTDASAKVATIPGCTMKGKIGETVAAGATTGATTNSLH
jgi:hypothetical protein